MVELKVAGIARMTVEAVKRSGFQEPVIYASFLHRELAHVRSADPEAKLMALFGKLPRATVARAINYKASHVGLRHDTATRRLVETFHNKGLRVWVYTANTTQDIRRALSAGVDGVISNFPDRIRE
jgi:glycerophosphoryl diester phosphodiesterase